MHEPLQNLEKSQTSNVLPDSSAAWQNELQQIRSGAARQIGSCETAPLSVGRTVEQTVSINGETRPYQVHMPSNWDGHSKLPVLYYFNGARPDGTIEPESFTGLSQEADRRGFAVVYMRGDSEHWQTYNNGQALFANGRDESAYLNRVHAALQRQIPLDERRQGLAGFSQGGSEAYALAANNSWISSVQGVEAYTTGYENPINHPVSEQNIHALRDRIVPINGTAQYEGQANREAERDLNATAAGTEAYLDIPMLVHAGIAAYERAGNNIQSQSETVQSYNRANDISGQPAIERVNDNTISTWTGSNGTIVRQVTLGDGSHGWAGSRDHSGDIPVVGVPSATFDASRAIGQFLLMTPLVVPSTPARAQ